MHNLSDLSLHQMESAISLRYCPFPYGSKVFQFQAARPSRIHLKFNHATPFCLPQISTTTYHVTRSFRHANCMLERFSVTSNSERKSCNKILRGVKAVSLVLACILGLFSFSAKMNPKFTTAYANGLFSFNKSQPNISQPNISLVGCDGKSVLKSLYEIMKDAEPSIDLKENPTRGPSQNRVKMLQWRAIHKRDYEALRELKDSYTKCKGNSQSRNFTGVALVEVFMFQGNFKEARNRLDEQIHELLQQLQDEKKLPKLTPKEMCEKLLSEYKYQMGDLKLGIAKRILYKAIVHTMLGQEEANEWWEAFTATLPCKSNDEDN